MNFVGRIRGLCKMKARIQSASEIRPRKAIRLTEKDLKRLDNDVEKTILGNYILDSRF